LIGAKLENMSANPSVCVEVDRIRTAADWYSVIMRGSFEQLENADSDRAVALIKSRLNAVTHAANSFETPIRTFVERKGGQGIAYRIRITEKHGRGSLSKISDEPISGE